MPALRQERLSESTCFLCVPPADAAKAFLAQRLHGESVKRSSEMLKPTKIGGIFVHPTGMR